jgi:tRNA (guanine-N7-)-methyltransferase
MSLLTARPSSTKFVVEDPCFLDVAEHPDWQNLFRNSHPLKLEIGFGMGDFLVAMAVREPHSNFIGIDFSQEGIRKILARINSLQIKNIRVAYGDVREKIPVLFKDGELDTVYINFPDPWPKKRHFKRRLIKPELATMIARKLTPEGHLHVATDSEPYALEMLEYFNAVPALQNCNYESGIFAERGHLPKTKYEKSFIYAGDKICYLEYSRVVADEKMKKPNAENEKDAEVLSNDEMLTKQFREAEARAKDACDLKQVADHLAEAGDRQWAAKVYQKAEDKVEDSLDLNWLAYSICLALGDKNWARQLYMKAEAMAESSLDCNWLAYSISETLGDIDWAKKLLMKAEAKPESVRELCDLADSIAEIFNDKDWQVNVYKKAEDKAKEHSDFYELADSICVKLGDKKWAGELYKKAEGKAQDSSDLISLGESLCGKLVDHKWAAEVFAKAESLVEDSIDLCSLADSLCDQLRDKEWAAKLYKNAERKAEQNYEFRWLAESLSEKIGDQKWAEQVYQKAEAKDS